MGPLFDPLFGVFEILGVLGKPIIWTTLGPTFWKNDPFLGFWRFWEKPSKKGSKNGLLGVSKMTHFVQNVKNWIFRYARAYEIMKIVIFVILKKWFLDLFRVKNDVFRGGSKLKTPLKWQFLTGFWPLFDGFWGFGGFGESGYIVLGSLMIMS